MDGHEIEKTRVLLLGPIRIYLGRRTEVQAARGVTRPKRSKVQGAARWSRIDSVEIDADKS